MIAIFYPLLAVGDFKLNSKICEYTNFFDFEIERYEGPAAAIHYSLYNPEITIFVSIETKRIDSIACHEELIYEGNNILGMQIDHFKLLYNVDHVGEIDEIEINGYPQLVYEFESLELQIWTKDDVIVTAIASSDIDNG